MAQTAPSGARWHASDALNHERDPQCFQVRPSVSIDAAPSLCGPARIVRATPTHHAMPTFSTMPQRLAFSTPFRTKTHEYLDISRELPDGQKRIAGLQSGNQPSGAIAASKIR